MLQHTNFPSLRFRSGRSARFISVALGLVMFTGASACSDEPLPASPDSSTDWPVVILPKQTIYHGSAPVQFTVTNVGTVPLQMGMCADGVQLQLLGRWIDAAGPTSCYLAVLELPPGGTQSVVYGLDQRLPDGKYRGRFGLWERGNGGRRLPAQFSTPFTLRRQFEISAN